MNCPVCRASVSETGKYKVGNVVYVNYVCAKGHTFTTTAEPVVKRKNDGGDKVNLNWRPK